MPLLQKIYKEKTKRSGWYELDEMVDTEFSPLNVVILKKIADGPSWSLGIEDEEFSQRKPDKGLITKKEIRVLSLACLAAYRKIVLFGMLGHALVRWRLKRQTCTRRSSFCD